MAAPMITVPEPVRAAQLASVEKLDKRLKDSKPEVTCDAELEVPEAFSCAICHYLFVKPRQCFPCRHSFCEPCLRQVADSDLQRDADVCPCPLCRDPIHYTRPNKSLEAQILHCDEAFASVYAQLCESYARNSELKAKPLPGLAALSFLPILDADFGRTNRALRIVTGILLWLSSTSTRSLLWDWFLQRTLQAKIRLVWLGACVILLPMISLLVRHQSFVPHANVRLVYRITAILHHCHTLPDTCPLPSFPGHHPTPASLAEPSSEPYLYMAFGLLTACGTVGRVLRRCGCPRLGNALSFVHVSGVCACALLSVAFCSTSLWRAAASLLWDGPD